MLAKFAREGKGSFQIYFIKSDEAGFFQKGWIIRFDLFSQHAKLGIGIARLFPWGKLDEKDEYRAALDMAQKGKAKTAVLVGIFDDARDVGDKKA